jgi:hypothetical protein
MAAGLGPDFGVTVGHSLSEVFLGWFVAFRKGAEKVFNFLCESIKSPVISPT